MIPQAELEEYSALCCKREKAREYSLRYYRKNREKVQACTKRSRKANPGKAHAAKLKRREADPHLERRSYLKRAYGITIEDYSRMLSEQGGVCKICGEPETMKHRGETTSSLCVDHDHSTGKVRGLLCGKCNTMLGKGDDSPERLRAGASYIEGNR